MVAWIEVSSGDWAWEGKIKEGNEKRGLKAPAVTRHINNFLLIREGDILFTYLTNSLTETFSWRKSIVGISIANSRCYKVNQQIRVDTVADTKLPIPIKLKDLRSIEGKSDQFNKLIQKSMQRYLTNISDNDVYNIIKIYDENYQHIMSLDQYSSIFSNIT
ncbi:hypothetical protein [Methanospirillum sp.]